MTPIQELSRRSLITGLTSFVVAPAIVRASSLMPVKRLPDYRNDPTAFIIKLVGKDLQAWQIDWIEAAFIFPARIVNQ